MKLLKTIFLGNKIQSPLGERTLYFIRMPRPVPRPEIS